MNEIIEQLLREELASSTDYLKTLEEQEREAEKKYDGARVRRKAQEKRIKALREALEI